MRFDEFNFDYDLLDGLDAMGFVNATPIQEQAIPLILDREDLIACAQTGTGKTAAFLLPVIQLIMDRRERKGISAIIIVPTRELAIQIDKQLEGLGYYTGVSSLPVYGGGDSKSWDRQKKALTKGADIIIATPGRMISHLNLGYVDLKSVEHLILDEADRMLDMGFFDDIMLIINNLPKKRQNLMFSATMPPKIRKLAKEMMDSEPKQITLSLSKPADGVMQIVYMVYERYKIELICKLIDGKKKYPSILVFSSTKKTVREITKALIKRKLPARAISSDLEQGERETVLQEFRARKVQILVATDILARGIDIKDINLVINYDIPRDAEDYVHRIGRTARADTSGVAITFISENDQYRFGKIEKLIEQEVRKYDTPIEIGESPKYQPNKKGNNFRGRGSNHRGKGKGGNRYKGSKRR